MWSVRNKRRAMELVRIGRMRKPGLQAVKEAQANGRWERAYPSYRESRVPGDLASELAERPAARKFFDSLDGRNRFAILFRLQNAVKPETRRRRLDKFVDMLKRHEKIYP